MEVTITTENFESYKNGELPFSVLFILFMINII